MKINKFFLYVLLVVGLWQNFVRCDLDDYGTHMAPLLTAVANTTGPVLEMGCGHFSTPLLHALCSANQRYLLTAETNRNWMSLFLYLERSWHSFIYVPVFVDDNLKTYPNPLAWDSIGNEIEWSVVFIDHEPGPRRREDIMRLKHHTKIFVIHDSQPSANVVYGYEEIYKTFRFRYDYKIYTTYTTLLSDTIDVAALFA